MLVGLGLALYQAFSLPLDRPFLRRLSEPTNPLQPPKPLKVSGVRTDAK